VQEWATRFNEVLEEERTYSGFKTKDPEGNVFEVYWEK
jgi:catechol-2,3-dioxygenase